MTSYNIASLERAIENVENNDAEAHKLYNNLGLAYAAARKYRLSLKAHREEKRACKRLAADDPNNSTRLLDLAIAYRRCGDVMLKVDRLIDVDGHVIDVRRDVIAAAREQHLKGLEWAKKVSGVQGTVEVQAASAAVAQSALALALDTKNTAQFVEAARCCFDAGRLADQLTEGNGVTVSMKESMLLGASLNMAIALSGLSQKDKAKSLLQAVAIRAKRVGDDGSFVRAMSNLAEEASDDEDWDLCECYVREWVRLAQAAGDEADESDALRKLAVVLREKRDLQGAKHALKRSLFLTTTRDGKQEARRFLEIIEQEIEELDSCERDLQELEEKGKQLEDAGNFVEEARTRIAAGNCAFALKRSEDVARLLGRYFVLVDDYGCNTAVTGVEEPAHNSAVANLAEVMWKMGRLEDAVKWATRELTCFDDDVAGQAQAWCNLGVYLDDFGKKDRAIEALMKSIALADESGEDDILKRAKSNLKVVRTDQEAVMGADSNRHDGIHLESTRNNDDVSPLRGMGYQQGPEESANDFNPRESRTEVAKGVPLREAGVTLSSRGNAPSLVRGEKSVVIISSQPHANNENLRPESGCSQDVSTRRSRLDPRKDPLRRTTHDVMQMKMDNQSRSNQSYGNTAECSSGGFKRVVDVVSEYKSLCSNRKPSVPIRPSLIAALRAVSSALIAREACDNQGVTLERLNVSSLFLSDQDVSVLFETLSRVSGEQRVHLDMSLNPLISARAYDFLAIGRSAANLRLDSVKWLDLSCAGMSGNSFRLLADSFGEQGSFSQVSHLNVSKNALGRQCRLTAQASARIVVRATRLEVLDLSLNLLANTFMKDLVSDIEKMSDAALQGAAVSSMRALDLHLNNRRSPSALLEGYAPDEAADTFSKLFRLLPSLSSVDVRACGASAESRVVLQDLPMQHGKSMRVIALSANVKEVESNF